MPLGGNPLHAFQLLSFLKGSAGCIGTASCAAGTDGDLLCRTIGLAIVIHAVLDLADNTVVVLLAVIGLAAAVLAFHVFFISFLWDGTIMDRRTRPYAPPVCQITPNLRKEVPHMSVFVIADTHLSGQVNKSMEKFGARWTGYILLRCLTILSYITEKYLPMMLTADLLKCSATNVPFRRIQKL